MKWMLILVLALTLVREERKPPIPGLCTPPPCAGTLVCADDSGCDCACFPGLN